MSTSFLLYLSLLFATISVTLLAPLFYHGVIPLFTREPMSWLRFVLVGIINGAILFFLFLGVFDIINIAKVL